MTEKQGGSDVRANTTTATPLNGGGPGAEYELTGHKWFMSAPMCDAFLVLAQADGGLSCFLMPRFTPDGERNRDPHPAAQGQARQPLERVERGRVPRRLGAAWSARRGAASRRSSRWSTTPASTAAIGAAAGMRPGVAPAIHHAAQRAAFGKLLIEQPLMQNVLADLAIESEAATIVGAAPRARLRRSRSPATSAATRSSASPTRCSSTGSASAARPTPVEALECFGGNGYVEESGMPRLYRESPLNSIWEGSGNVQCLDVLRAMAADPEARRGVLRRGRRGRGADPAPRRRRRRAARPSSATSRRSSRAPAAWSSGWRWCSRARCWSASATRRSPTPSAPRAWTATGAAPSAPCPAGTDFERIIARHTRRATVLGSEPALVEAPDHRLAEPHRVGEGRVVDVLGGVGGPVVVGRLLELGAPSTAPRTDSRRQRLERRRSRFAAAGSGTARSRARSARPSSSASAGAGTRASSGIPPPAARSRCGEPTVSTQRKNVRSRGSSAKWRSPNAFIPSLNDSSEPAESRITRTELGRLGEQALGEREQQRPPRWRCRWRPGPHRASRCRPSPPRSPRRAGRRAASAARLPVSAPAATASSGAADQRPHQRRAGVVAARSRPERGRRRPRGSPGGRSSPSGRRRGGRRAPRCARRRRGPSSQIDVVGVRAAAAARAAGACRAAARRPAPPPRPRPRDRRAAAPAPQRGESPPSAPTRADPERPPVGAVRVARPRSAPRRRARRACATSHSAASRSPGEALGRARSPTARSTQPRAAIASQARGVVSTVRSHRPRKPNRRP